MWAQAFELVKRAQSEGGGAGRGAVGPWKDPAEDQRLDGAMQGIHNLVLVAHLDPLPSAMAAGKIRSPSSGSTPRRSGTTAPTSCRATASLAQIPLEERTAVERHWSLALEAFRLARGARILESPNDLQIGAEVIPAPRAGTVGRPLRVLYTREPIPSVSLKELIDQPELGRPIQRTGRVHRRDFYFGHL